jgi:hypothetical protein
MKQYLARLTIRIYDVSIKSYRIIDETRLVLSEDRESAVEKVQAYYSRLSSDTINYSVVTCNILDTIE